MSLRAEIFYLNLGTTRQTTENNVSGEIGPLWPCHNAHSIFLSSSTNDLFNDWAKMHETNGTFICTVETN